MFHVKTLTTKEKGDIGENIASAWLISKGFLIVERNYRKKWGELDIVATKDKILHFIEVKSAVNQAYKGHRPEENVHELKQRRLKRTIQTFLAEKKYGLDAVFQFHILTISTHKKPNDPEINFIENIIL